MRFASLVVVIAAAVASAEPKTIYGPLVAPTTANVKDLFCNGASFSALESMYTFSSDGSIKAYGIYASSGNGRWRYTKGTFSGDGRGFMGMACSPKSKRPEVDCPWTFSFSWDVKAVARDAVLIEIADETAGQLAPRPGPRLLVCRPGYKENERKCTAAEDDGSFTVNLIQGNADRALYDPARKFLAEAWKSDSALLFEAETAKTPRTVSEIYYGPDKQQFAQSVAAELAPILGTLEPQEWPSPTGFDVLVVVGNKKSVAIGETSAATPPPPPPLRVAVSDGKCIQGSKDCTNPLVATIRTKLGNDFAVSATTQAKIARADTEVWFMKNSEEKARKLAKDRLGELVKSENIKEWTWPGYFDVLIVVGGGGPK